jgi:NAD(P)-dependent dehydrogenase (short-subunit alcohol dehydrogenase family)
MGLLDAKVAILTGGAFGIGRATALHLATEGAAVVIGDIKTDKATDIADEISSAGGQAIAQHCDVADERSVVELMDTAVRTFGGIDLRDSDALDADLDTWDRVHQVNTKGALLLPRHAIPSMISRGGGAIVNISSGSASIGEITRVAYGVSKAGVEQLTRHLANRYGRNGIRANAVAPGFILTASSAKGVPESYRTLLADQNPTGRLGAPDDIAHVVAFLLSDRAGYINGQVIHVDGGTQIAGTLPGPSGP